MTTQAQFNGFQPEDWVDELFVVELRFEGPLDDSELNRLGAAWPQWKGAREIYDWELSGAFAYVPFLPLRNGEQRALDSLRSWVGETCPTLVEASFLGGPLDRLDAPGPAYPGAPRPVDESLAAPTKHPAFQAGADETRTAMAHAELEGLLAEASKKKVGLKTVAPTPNTGAGPAWLMSCGSEAQVTGVYGNQTIGWVSQLKLSDFSLPEGLTPCFSTWWAAQDDEQVLLGVQEQPLRYTPDNSATTLLRVQRGTCEKVWSAPNEDQGFHQVAWLDDSTVLVRTNKRLEGVDLTAGEELASVKGKLTNIAVGHGSTVVAAERANGVALFTWSRPRLKRLVAYKHKNLRLAGAVGDELRLQVGSLMLALTGIEQV